MVTKGKLRSLDSLREAIRKNPKVEKRLAPLWHVQDLLMTERPTSVRAVVAFGRLLKSLDSEKLPRDGLQILAIAKSRRAYTAHKELAEKVFGPLLLQLGRLPDYEIWTSTEFEDAKKQKHKYLGTIQRDGGVLVYGDEPDLG